MKPEPTARETARPSETAGELARERLTCFFYILTRNALPFGEVERIFAEHVDGVRAPVAYSEPNAAAYARSLGDRILGEVGR